jgi:peroxiredoxin
VSTGSQSGRLAPWVILGVGLLLGLGAGLVAFVGLPKWPGTTNAAGARTTPAPAPVEGAPAPDFTLNNLAGSAVKLSDLKGQVVLVNFWATWCGPCRLEMPAIQKQYDALKDKGFTVLAVNLDEPAGDVSKYTSELALTFPVLLDPGAKVNDLYRVRGYPTTFFVNRDGLIDREHVGYMSDSQLKDYLTHLGLFN